MRTAEIQALFEYLYWIRDRVLSAAGEAGRLDSVRATLVHELDVESGWRARLRGDEETDLDPANFPTIDAIADHWHRDELEMRGVARESDR